MYAPYRANHGTGASKTCMNDFYGSPRGSSPLSNKHRWLRPLARQISCQRHEVGYDAKTATLKSSKMKDEHVENRMLTKYNKVDDKWVVERTKV